MEKLLPQDILNIHFHIIEEIGGAHGIRGLGMIVGISEMSFQIFEGKELYPSVYDKTAVYFHRIIMNHPFIDGNKRTALIVASIFLERSGYSMIAKKGEFEEFALRAVEEHLDISYISDWFKKHSQKFE